MTKQYNIEKIRTLLTEGFSDEELRRYCHDEPDFKYVYHKLAQNTGKIAIIDELLAYADQKSLIDKLLDWAKDQNPRKYNEHRPYYYDDNTESDGTKGKTKSTGNRVENKSSQDELYHFYIDQIRELFAHNSSPDSRGLEIGRALTLDRFKQLVGIYKGLALKFLCDSKLISSPEPIINLSGADLSGTDLKNVDLRGIYLSGVDLSEANLQEVDLRQADLSKANLRGAVLTNTNLRGAKLNQTQLRGVDLSTVNLLETELIRADLIGANLSGAKLEGANLTSAFLGGANLKGVNLGTSSLSKNTVTSLHFALLGGADLSETNLKGVNLIGADLGNAKLIEADLQGVDLRGVDLSEADLSKAKLLETDLRNAILRGANLTEAYLGGADFTGANLSGANLTEAYLGGADFTGANLTDVKVTLKQLEQVRALKHARMPDGELYTPTVASLSGEIFNKTVWVCVFVGLGMIGLFRNCWGVIAGVIIGVACFFGLAMAYDYTKKNLGIRWIVLWGTILNAIWGGAIFAILGGITSFIALIIIEGLWGLLQFIYSIQDGFGGVSEVMNWIHNVDKNLILFFGQLFAVAGTIWGGTEGFIEGGCEYSVDIIDTKVAIINILGWGATGMFFCGLVAVGLSTIGRGSFAGDSILFFVIVGVVMGIIKGLYKTLKRYLMLKEEEGYWKLYL